MNKSVTRCLLCFTEHYRTNIIESDLTMNTKFLVVFGISTILCCICFCGATETTAQNLEQKASQMSNVQGDQLDQETIMLICNETFRTSMGLLHIVTWNSVFDRTSMTDDSFTQICLFCLIRLGNAGSFTQRMLSFILIQVLRKS